MLVFAHLFRVRFTRPSGAMWPHTPHVLLVGSVALFVVLWHLAEGAAWQVDHGCAGWLVRKQQVAHLVYKVLLNTQVALRESFRRQFGGASVGAGVADV